MGEEEKKILSVEDVLHLQSDKHTKEIMPDVDTSRYILTQKQKTAPTRNFTPAINLTEEERRQFNQGGTAPSRNAVLAKQSLQAIQIAKLHAEEEAAEHAKAVAERTDNAAEAAKLLAKEIRDGDFNFGALIEGYEDLKETI